MTTGSWTLLPENLTFADNQIDSGTVSPAVAVNVNKSNIDFLGCGIIRPLRRDQKNDYANACGHELVRSCLGQVIGTRARTANIAGDIPWRSDFGSHVYTLLYENDPAALNLVGVYIREAVKRWEPRATILSVSVEHDESYLHVSTTYKIDNNNLQSNNASDSIGVVTFTNQIGTDTFQVAYQVGSP